MDSYRRLRLTALGALIAGVAVPSWNRHDAEAARRSFASIGADLQRNAYAVALDAAQRGSVQWSDRPYSEPYIRYRLFEAEALLRLDSRAPARTILANLLSGTGELGVRRDLYLAGSLRWQDPDRARELLDRALRGAEASSLHALHIEALRRKGTLLFDVENWQEAEKIDRQALAEAERLNDPIPLAFVLHDLGTIHLMTSRCDQAIAYFNRVIKLLGERDEPALKALTMGDHATCSADLGESGESLKMQTTAVGILKRVNERHRFLVSRYGEIGRLYDRQGDVDNAIKYYSLSLHLAELNDDRGQQKINLGNLASTYLLRKDWKTAESFNERAKRLAVDSDDQYLKMNTAEIAFGKNHPEVAKRLWTELARNAKNDYALRWGAMAQMAKHSNDPTTAKGFYEGAINLIAGKRSEVKESDYRIAFLTEPIHIYQSYVEWLAVREDWQRALEVADSSHSQVLMEGYGRAKLSRAALQQFARESKSILLAYWLAPSGSFVWVITAGGIKGMPLDDTTDTEIKKLVAEHTANIEGSEEILGNPQSAGWKLYEKLLKPVEDRIPRDANVIVIPDGAINRLNLETLPAAGNQYWLERNTLSVAPSIEALLASGSGLVSWDKALIMGAVPQVDRFPKLAHAGKEIDAVRKHWRGQKPIVLEDKEATVTAYRASHPDEFSLIHFSSHADAKVERALNAAIITAEDANGYRLYARDVSRAEHRLRANLVTVSACESAGTMFYSGEGLIGFAWAFLHAGARNVVAGLWKADEDATAQLMDMFYAEIEKGNSPAAALRTAKLNLRPMAFNYSKPYYWGTFQLYRRSIR